MNHGLACMVTFLRWCERRRLVEANPLRYVQKARIRDGRGYRRALSVADLGHFFASVPPHRAVVYMVAYYTGLRRNELRRLRRGDFHLEGPSPCVRVPDSVSKNGKTQEVPLHRALVPLLGAYWSSDTPSFAWGFRGHVPKIGTWKGDLERAGIPFVDAEGRRFDFHALRHTLCTHLREARVGLRDAMAIMRHSDPRLTMNVYTDERQVAVASEIAKLPDIGGAVVGSCRGSDSVLV